MRNINLKIGVGEAVALAGMSGGGKSTLADLVPRFYDPEEGAVLIDGVDIKRFLVGVAMVPDRRRLAEYFPLQ